MLPQGGLWGATSSEQVCLKVLEPLTRAGERQQSSGCDISPGKVFETVQTEKVSSSRLPPPPPPRVPQNICLPSPSKARSRVCLNTLGAQRAGPGWALQCPRALHVMR